MFQITKNLFAFTAFKATEPYLDDYMSFDIIGALKVVCSFLLIRYNIPHMYTNKALCYLDPVLLLSPDVIINQCYLGPFVIWDPGPLFETTT